MNTYERPAIHRIIASLLLAAISSMAVAREKAIDLKLTAAQIVDKNVAARGGLEAWHKVDTMIEIGHLETTNAAAPLVPFVLQLKRPNKSRFEIHSQDSTSVRIFNGTTGWRVRPQRGGVPELTPFTPTEVKAALDAPGIDGPLFDYLAKGVSVDLDGIDEIDGHKAFRLAVFLASGAARHIWIDATTFLDVKSDRKVQTATGESVVTVAVRNYKLVNGLQIPHTIETVGAAGHGSEKMVIEQVIVNSPLTDHVFTRPNVPMRAPVNPMVGAGPQRMPAFPAPIAPSAPPSAPSQPPGPNPQ